MGTVMIRFFATAATLLLIIAFPSGAQAGSNTIDLVPSGADDTAAFQAALDAASSGPTKTIRLAPGTYNVTRTLVGLNSDVVIVGSGTSVTTVLANGSSNPSGLFELGPTGASALGVQATAYLFYFQESDVDTAGQPLDAQRSLNVVIKDLTLGARGRTQPHFDINAGTNTQRMFSLVWMNGYRPNWINSAGSPPSDIGMIDAEHARISTIRARFQNVHFDGRNRDRADGEPGGPFDPNPDVRNATGFEGGIDVVSLPPDPLVFFFKPINADIVVIDSLFTSFPGQAGIFAPQLVGVGDPAWTFGPGAVSGRVAIRDSVFEDIFIPLLVPDVSSTKVSVSNSVFLRSGIAGIIVATNFQSTEGGLIGYPASASSKVRVSDSLLDDANEASVLLDEYFGPPLLDAQIQENEFVLAAPFQAGIFGINTANAKIADNIFTGVGYAAIVGLASTGWRIDDNDFCGLFVPPNAPSAFGLPPNADQAPIASIFSSGFRVTESDCASFFQFPFEDPSNVIIIDDDH